MERIKEIKTSAEENTSGFQNEDLNHMPILAHLGELRYRLIFSLISVFVFFIGCLGFSTQILNFLKKPLEKALPGVINTLHFTGPLDVFFVSVKISMLAGIVLSCPVWFYQFWKFLEPALYQKERKLIFPCAATSILLFTSGSLFCFYVVLPIGLKVLIGMGQEVGTPIITITDYTSLLCLMIFSFGIIFETPLILVLLALLDLISSKNLSKYRRHSIIIALIIGAILTPPDPFTQIAMAVPLYLMFEISILIIKGIEKFRASK